MWILYSLYKISGMFHWEAARWTQYQPGDRLCSVIPCHLLWIGVFVKCWLTKGKSLWCSKKTTYTKVLIDLYGFAQIRLGNNELPSMH